MQISELVKYGIPASVVERLKLKGIEKLNPAQEAAVKSGVLDGRNLVLASPTASGKTLVAILAIAKKIYGTGGKALYIVPLRALASEKYVELKEFFSGYRVAISTGDYDSSDEKLGRNDIIVVTVEKLDSLMRHNISWLGNVAITVADEVHLLNDAGRGPTLEIVLTRLKKIKAQTLALSATVKNAAELASWLEAEKVASGYRPVKLWEGVYDGKKIRFLNKGERRLESDKDCELALAADTLLMKKQAIIFAGTRKNAEASAEKAAERAKNFLSAEEKEKLKGISEKILSALGSPTRQCKKASELAKSGVAFHHAGLANSQRKIIEQGFREGLIKIICATPTLAAGVNLPAYRCIMRDMKRFYAGFGSRHIPVLEYRQMTGRAGRPQFDSEGEAIMLAKTQSEAEELFEKYILGEPEEITSKLAVEPILKTHALALIASGLGTNEEISEFFSKTFHAYQYGNAAALNGKLRNVIAELLEWGLVETHGISDSEIRATRIGKRISELYLNPETGWNFSRSLGLEAKTFGLLQLITSSPEMAPQLRVKNSEYDEINGHLAKREAELMRGASPPTVPPIYQTDEILDSFKTALFLESWCSEKGEDFIFEKFGVSPGELHARLEIADWLLYCCHELALLLGKKESLSAIKKLRTRLRYGVKEELLPLVRLRGIGRVRARKLWNSGVRSVLDLRKIPAEKLADIVGRKTAEEIKEQITDGKTEDGQTESKEYDSV